MNRDQATSLADSLVRSLIPGTSNDHLQLSHLRNWVIRELKNDTQGGTRRDWVDARRALDGLTHAARVRVQGDLAEGLEKVTRILGEGVKTGAREWDEGLPVTATNIPQHIQLLLNLASPPSTKTHRVASSYLARRASTGPTPEQVLYREIMSEPFEGDHWDSKYDEEVKEGWTDSDSSGSSGGSEEDEEVVTPSSRIAAGRQVLRTGPGLRGHEEEEQRVEKAKEVLRLLGEQAYWRRPGEELQGVPEGTYRWRQISTDVTPLVLSHSAIRQRVKVISAIQFQREMLMALTGRPNLLLDFSSTGCSIKPDHPSVHHYSPSALLSVLESLRSRSSQLVEMRDFVDNDQNSHGGPAKTRTAFVESLRSVLRDFAIWVAEMETALIRGEISDPSSSSTLAGRHSRSARTPMELLLSVEDGYGAIIDHLALCLEHAASPVILTNTLYAAYTSSLHTTSPATSSRLFEVFSSTAEPLWTSLGRWLTRGIPIPLALVHEDLLDDAEAEYEEPFDPEFYILRDRDVSWADEDFWECAWVIGSAGWPDWIGEEIREGIIEAGKARGLLRGLQGDAVGTKGSWSSLKGLIQKSPATLEPSNEICREHETTTVETTIATYVEPLCSIATHQLRKVLEVDCGLMAHLDAIEGMLYMRSSTVTDEWTKWLYTQIRESRRTWADFQTLTHSYRETIAMSAETWMNAPAIRMSLTGRLKGQTGTEAIGLIRADYQVPFPLSQLLSLTSMELRSDVFTFLLQLGYCRDTIHGLYPCQARGTAAKRISRDVARLGHLKHRILWLLDALWIWLHDRVLELQTRLYRDQLAAATSLGKMIQLELAHTRLIRKYAFLHDSTSIIDGCVHDIMAIAQSLPEISRQIRIEADAPADRTPLRSREQGRSNRRQNKHRPDTLESSDSDRDPKEVETAQMAEMSVLSADLGPHERLRRSERRLAEIVDVLKERVADLAYGEVQAGNEGEREVWGMLDFALEDWRIPEE